MLTYDDPALDRLFDDIATLITSGSGDTEAIDARLIEIAIASSPAVADYWRRSRHGVPDHAFKGESPFWFPHVRPARTFRTSGTTGQDRGSAHYSARGLKLMELSILTAARRNIVTDALESPAIIRLVPPEAIAPEMVMAYGMELISARLGHRDLSACAVGPHGFDLPLLAQRLDAAVAVGLPVVLIGASFAFVNLCDALEGRTWSLPRGSRAVDAGGFKGRARATSVDSLRSGLERTFGIPPNECVNLFGMTELASQLYDATDTAVGPLGERPKRRERFVEPRVRDPYSMELVGGGAGLLEVVDRCIIDRPHIVLTGDRAICHADGVAIVGRVDRHQSRGCSLSLDELTRGAPHV